MKAYKFVLIMGIFLLGWISSTLFAYGGDFLQPNLDVNVPDVTINNLDLAAKEKQLEYTQFSEPPERDSPYDHIKESQIHVTDSGVTIDIQGAEWAKFTDTNSMDPVLDEWANAIEFIPTSPDQIHVGDIVSYYSEIADTTIIHRVVEYGEDAEGPYWIFKGDNIPIRDPEQVRFEQIRRVVVAIIY